jgi:hypothetical protein
MPSDLKGEVFEELINGVDTVRNLVPLAPRADKTILLVDGEQISEPALRQSATLRARQLIGALAETGGVQRHKPLMITLSKKDLLDDAASNWWEIAAGELVEHARGCGLTTVDRLEVAARPKNHSAPIGLKILLDWMCAAIDVPPVATRNVEPQSDRVFLTGSLG